MNDAEYPRLLKILTLSACRILGVTASTVLGESGKSPADFAAETLILWGTDKLKFCGPPEALTSFLLTVMRRAIISTLRKKPVQMARKGKMSSPDDLTDDDSPQSALEDLFTIRSLLRDQAVREALVQCTAEDAALKQYVDAIETLEDMSPAPRDIADLLDVSVTDIYNRKKKLARRLVQLGITGSRRRSKV